MQAVLKDQLGRTVCAACGKVVEDAADRKADWMRRHRAKRLCVLCRKPLEGKQARYCAECAAVLSDPRSARMKKALPKTADGMKLTIENVVELCRHYRAPYSSYGHMMSYLTQYHAMPPKEYRR